MLASLVASTIALVAAGPVSSAMVSAASVQVQPQSAPHAGSSMSWRVSGGQPPYAVIVLLNGCRLPADAKADGDAVLVTTGVPSGSAGSTLTIIVTDASGDVVEVSHTVAS